MTDNQTTELLPCPFCGGEANIIDHHNDDGSVSVGCNNDTCLGFSGLGWLYKTEAEAISAWNTRAELGSGTCRDVSANPLRFECSECGGLSIEIAPRFCPCCGREVVFEC